MVRKLVHTCNLCNKNYASYQSLCNHRTKIHAVVNNSIEQHTQQHITALNNLNIIEFNCRKCNKSYKHQQSRSRHELKCNKNQEIIENIENNTHDNSTINNITNTTDNGTINNGTINNNNNTTTNNGTINNTIVINNFNEDNFYGDRKSKKIFYPIHKHDLEE
jgi:hypothetical protein